MSFPPIRATDLVPFQRLQTALEIDPGLLSRPGCPYGPDVLDFIARLSPLAAVREAESVLLGAEGERFDVITSQIDKIYSELNSLVVSDPSERIQIAKAKAMLLEKLVTLHERTMGLKQVSEFKKAVIAAVDALSVAERDAFLGRLEAAGDDA
jgi:hypothetical protein